MRDMGANDRLLQRTTIMDEQAEEFRPYIRRARQSMLAFFTAMLHFADIYRFYV